ncbi:hypothetical protein ACFQH9_12050 [Pseudonocardia lutea]|uniref:MHYT domain-containing protein n=1 Tax=Pseudonocardia lutea TaxID=2172015 RepID=A0ABW1I9H1_9PSEU
MTASWFTAGAVAACAASGAGHLAQLVLRRRSRIEVHHDLVQLSMSAGMAAMLVGHAASATTAIVALIVLVTWPVVARGPMRDAVDWHHVVAAGAMLFMAVVGHSSAYVHATSFGISLVALASSGYYLSHLMSIAAGLEGPTRSGGVLDRVTSATMSSLMVVMLLGML